MKILLHVTRYDGLLLHDVTYFRVKFTILEMSHVNSMLCYAFTLNYVMPLHYIYC